MVPMQKIVFSVMMIDEQRLRIFNTRGEKKQTESSFANAVPPAPHAGVS
jgi:hypothetical protein